jgi:hypothetical protein
MYNYIQLYYTGAYKEQNTTICVAVIVSSCGTLQRRTLVKGPGFPRVVGAQDSEVAMQ